MRQIETGNPDLLIYRADVETGAILSIPFFLAILGMVWPAMGGFVSSLTYHSGIVRFILFVIVMASTCYTVKLGAQLLGGPWITFDRVRRTVTFEKGIPVRRGARIVPLDGFEQVRTYLEVRTSTYVNNGVAQQEQSNVYVLVLEKPYGQPMQLHEDSSQQHALDMGLRIATFLGLERIDATGAVPVVHPAPAGVS